MQLELLWAFFIIFAIDSITPGPAVAMVMSRGASAGLFRTLPFIAGLVIGDLFLFAMALLGLVALAKTYSALFLVVKWIGIVYLLYLAYNAWHANSSSLIAEPQRSTGIRSFILALALPLGNPKAVGFYVALLPAFMNIEVLSFATALSFGLTIVVVWSSVLVFYAYCADRGRRYASGADAIKWLNKCAAASMVGVAGTIAFRE